MKKSFYRPVFATKDDLAKYFSFKPASESDNVRLDKAWELYKTNYKGHGCLGCCAEMLTATTNSSKTTISNAGRVDCFIKYKSASGYVVPVSCERKTNGGRVETVENEFSKAEHIEGKYVVYSLDVCNSSTSGKRRYVPAVVIPRLQFLEKLIEFKAIKKVYKYTEEGERYLDGYGIQSSSKQLYAWLSDWPIVYDRNAVYSDEDFEGLE